MYRIFVSTNHRSTQAMTRDYATEQLAIATQKANEARAAIANATTKKAKHAAYDDLEFWTNKKAFLHVALDRITG